VAALKGTCRSSSSNNNNNNYEEESAGLKRDRDEGCVGLGALLLLPLPLECRCIFVVSIFPCRLKGAKGKRNDPCVFPFLFVFALYNYSPLHG